MEPDYESKKRSKRGSNKKGKDEKDTSWMLIGGIGGAVAVGVVITLFALRRRRPMEVIDVAPQADVGSPPEE